MRSREHSLFTMAEEQAMAKRLKGDYSDPTGIFANRIYPKLIEIQTWHTPQMKKRIRTLLQYRRKIREDKPAKPNKESTFEEFRQTTGY